MFLCPINCLPAQHITGQAGGNYIKKGKNVRTFQMGGNKA